MNHPLLQLMSIQFKEFFREPGALFWTFIFPILMAWGLGIAFTQKDTLIRNVAVISGEQKLKKIPLLLAQEKQGVETDTINTHKVTVNNKKMGNSAFQFLFTDQSNALQMMKKGKISLFLSERNDTIIYHFDPTNTEARLMQLQLETFFTEGQISVDESRIEPMTSTGTRYIDFLIPGLIAMGIMNSCLWGISYSLIDKRSKKLLRRMIATPMKKWHFLLAQLLTRIILTLLETAALILFANLYFNVQIDGDITALFAVILAGNAAFIGIAILISSRTANPHVGGGLINFVSMPMMVLSGVFFSYHNFPEWTIPYIQALPLTAFADSIRTIMIEGAGWNDTLIPMISLFAIGAITYLSGLKIYKWY